MTTDFASAPRQDCPLLVQADAGDACLEEWIARRRVELEDALLTHKAILMRGFRNRDGLHGIAQALFSELASYRYRSTPRTELGQFVYTATEYPKQLAIPQHCENAYQRSWPLKLLFHCVIPADQGGRTPLADMDRVTADIDPAVREEFERRGVRYVRNYRNGVDLPWEEVFGTRDQREVERFCAEHDIGYAWLEHGLRTSQDCQAMAHHPLTGRKVWFNQAHLFHISSLEPASQQMMLSFFGEEGLPRNAYFGDGGRIEPSMLEHIRDAYDRNKIHFDWQRDDVLLVDNMQVSHGRDPYEGQRKVLVCMAQNHTPADAGGRPTHRAT